MILATATALRRLRGRGNLRLTARPPVVVPMVLPLVPAFRVLRLPSFLRALRRFTYKLLDLFCCELTREVSTGWQLPVGPLEDSELLQCRFPRHERLER